MKEIFIKANEYLSYSFLSNSLYKYITSFVIFFISIKILYYFKKYALSKIEELSKNTETKIDDALIEIIKGISWLEYQIIAIYLATRNLTFPITLSNIIKYLLIFSITYRVVISLEKLLKFTLEEISGKEYEKSIKIIGIIFRVVIWIIAVLFILHNLGVKITALLTGLGIGGIAIAMASQTILGDMFNFFVILLDKPFKIGDFIVLPSQKLSGTVEEIGLKSVKIRTLTGDLLIITNSKIMSEIIQNFSYMIERRVVFTLNIVYNTPEEKLKLVPKIVKEVIENTENARFDRSNIINLGSYSIDFENVYYVKSSDYDLYVRTNEKILSEIFKKFKENNISFAYPTQKIILEGGKNG